jgi:hypothetical protein
MPVSLTIYREAAIMYGLNSSKKVENHRGQRDNSRNHSQRSIDRTGQVYELHEQDYTTKGFKTI